MKLSETSKFYTYAALVFVCIIATLILHYCYSLTILTPPLYEESNYYNASRLLPPSSLVSFFSSAFCSEELYSIILFIAFTLLGNSLFVFTFYVICFYILLIISTYLLGKELFNARSGFWAAFLTATSPLILDQSIRHQPFIALAAFLLLSLYFLIKSNFLQDRLYAVLFGITINITAGIHYSFALYLVPLLALFFIELIRKNIIGRKNVYIYTGIMLCLLLVSYWDKQYFYYFLFFGWACAFCLKNKILSHLVFVSICLICRLQTWFKADYFQSYFLSKTVDSIHKNFLSAKTISSDSILDKFFNYLQICPLNREYFYTFGLILVLYFIIISLFSLPFKKVSKDKKYTFYHFYFMTTIAICLVLYFLNFSSAGYSQIHNFLVLFPLGYILLASVIFKEAAPYVPHYLKKTIQYCKNIAGILFFFLGLYCFIFYKMYLPNLFPESQIIKKYNLITQNIFRGRFNSEVMEKYQQFFYQDKRWLTIPDLFSFIKNETLHYKEDEKIIWNYYDKFPGLDLPLITAIYNQKIPYNRLESQNPLLPLTVKHNYLIYSGETIKKSIAGTSDNETLFPDEKFYSLISQKRYQLLKTFNFPEQKVICIYKITLN